MQTAKREELYKTLVQLKPELCATAMVIEAARKMKVKYPINDYDGLLQLVDKGSNHCKLEDGTKLTLKQAKTFFPKCFFPIEDEDSFIGRLVAAFTWGNEVHRFEEKITIAKKELG